MIGPVGKISKNRRLHCSGICGICQLHVFSSPRVKMLTVTLFTPRAPAAPGGHRRRRRRRWLPVAAAGPPATRTRTLGLGVNRAHSGTLPLTCDVRSEFARYCNQSSAQ